MTNGNASFNMGIIPTKIYIYCTLTNHNGGEILWYIDNVSEKIYDSGYTNYGTSQYPTPWQWSENYDFNDTAVCFEFSGSTVTISNYSDLSGNISWYAIK